MEFVVGLILGILLGGAGKRVARIYNSDIEDEINQIQPREIKKTVGLPLPKDFPRAKGIVVLPESDRDIAREKLLEENKKRGVDTPLEALQ